MVAILAILAVAIFYFAPQATELLNLTSFDTQQISESSVVSKDDNLDEIIPLQSQVEADQLLPPFASQSQLPDLAPTLGGAVNVFLLPDLAPTILKSPRDAYDLPDLAPTFANPSLGVYRYTDLAPTLVQAQEEPDRLPDLAPTIVKSQDQDTIDRLPDLTPTLP
jgi:hypothetical protein